jgi:pimeloyl-ACP methyl ester carboxylesterase
VTTTTTEPVTQTLEVPGATLTYDVRRNDESTEPPLMLIGFPMAAAGFVTLASHFTDRTVITYDPRGSERSDRTDPEGTITSDVNADDIHRVVAAVGGGPVDLFATSGGAINALALVAQFPDDVQTLVAHEPPLASMVPDREHARAATRAVHETYQRRGWGAGMAHFIAIVSHRGPFTAEVVAQPAPNPAMFGMPTEDDGSRADPMLGNITTLTQYEPDWDALRSSRTRIVLAAGEESDGELAQRGAYACAERLGIEPVSFPGDHAGFLGGEYGQTGQPEPFAGKLREVLTTG